MNFCQNEDIERIKGLGKKRTNSWFLPNEQKNTFQSLERISTFIEETTETISDWLNWLETVEDVEVKRRISPRVEELKKQIADLWSFDFVVEEGKSALNGFARQFIIREDDSLSPQDFLRKVRKKVVDLMKNNPQTKVKLILD